MASFEPEKNLKIKKVFKFDEEAKAFRDEKTSALDESVRRVGEIGYIEDTITFTQQMKESLPENQVEEYDKKQREVRDEVSKQWNEEFEAREDKVENRVVRANEKVIRQEIERENANNIRVLEHFKPGLVPTPNHKQKGFSQFAIDPASIPENLREAYLSDPKLKKRKVFVEGGMTLQESAALIGETPESLIKTLANAPTQKEMIAERKKRVKQRRKEVQESRAERVDERRDKIYDDYAKLHVREMSVIRDNKFSALTTGTRKIALPLPKIAEINNTARVALRNTKVGDVNPRQYNQGEKSSNRKALNHILKNEAEQAFVAKERAILNSELTRESLKARSEILKAKSFVKNLTSRKGMKTFKKAGLLPQVNEILSLFDLTGSKPKGRAQDSYIQYLESIDAAGEVVIVPESLNEVRASGTELTVEQYLRVTDRLRTLNKQAKLKNKLMKNQVKRQEMGKLQTEEAIATDAVLDLKAHPNYKKSRIKNMSKVNQKGVGQVIYEKFGVAESYLTNFKNVVTELDQENLSGQHWNNLVIPMNDGEGFKRNRLHQVVGHIKEIANDYGEQDFKKAFNEFVEIPEFNDISELSNGVMAKSDLWMMFAYLGDPSARERLSNFVSKDGTVITPDLLTSILERHLDHKDAKLAQNFVNIFKSFEEEGKALHERTTGVTPTMVKGVPIEFKGRVYDGGYVPLNYTESDPNEKASRWLEIMGEKKLSMFGDNNDGKLYGILRAAEQTDQGRLAERQKTVGRKLDTDFRGLLNAYEEHVHDIAYREAGSDVLKLLRNPAYSKAIIGAVGQLKYDVMVSGVIETVGQPHKLDSMNPFAKQENKVEEVYKKMVGNFSVANLGFKASSVAMQPMSMGAAGQRMGTNGGKYISKSLAQVMKSLSTGEYGKLFDEAARINNDLITQRDSVDDTLIQSTFDFIPVTGKTKYAAKLAVIGEAKQKVVDTSMVGLKALDIHIKAAVTLASYAQFISGDVKNFPMSRLSEMSQAEVEVQAQRYAKQVADLALTTSAKIDKSAVEKIALMRIFTSFYTDSRSQLNTTLSQYRKGRLSVQRGVKAFQEGDKKKAIGHSKEAAAALGSFMAYQGLMQLYVSSFREDDNLFEQLGDVNSFDDFKGFVGNAAKFATLKPFESVLEVTPILRDMKFGAGGFRSRKEVRLPLNSIFSDATTAMLGLGQWLQLEGMNKAQHKAFISTAANITGLPKRGPNEILDTMNDMEIFGDVADFIRNVAGYMVQEVKEFADRHADNPDMQDTIEAVKELSQELAPGLQQGINIPEDALETLKLNKWDDLNPVTGAVGIYQFTEERWEEISEANPALDLTDEGRESKDTREQEKAMNWSLEQNAQRLSSFSIDVNNENLYGIHRFGDDFIAIMLSDKNENLTDIVENETLFEGFKTIKQVKNYIRQQVKPIDNN